ncbi:MAG: ImmA/IrrE family metallo-endopeptidase [Ignavibacteriota bacterium]
MPKIAIAPVRKAEVIALAAAAQAKYSGMKIDEVADRENIILIREPDPDSKKAGYACSLKIVEPKFIPSVSRPGEYILSFAEKNISYTDCIVINPLYGISDQEIFWHEFYHLWYSPSRKLQADFFHQYSTEGVLDHQEERRANMFAAYFLIPEVAREDTPQMISEKFNVSREMSQLRLHEA